PTGHLLQLDVVVDLAIEDDDQLAILRAHGLVASRAQVQDGEPAKTEPHVVVEVQARVVRAPVGDALRHPGQDRRVCRSTTEAEHHYQTAHFRPRLSVLAEGRSRINGAAGLRRGGHKKRLPPASMPGGARKAGSMR